MAKARNRPTISLLILNNQPINMWRNTITLTNLAILDFEILTNLLFDVRKKALFNDNSGSIARLRKLFLACFHQTPTWLCKGVEYWILVGQRRSARTNWVDFHRAGPTFEARLALVEDEVPFRLDADMIRRSIYPSYLYLFWRPASLQARMKVLYANLPECRFPMSTFMHYSYTSQVPYRSQFPRWIHTSPSFLGSLVLTISVYAAW
jgi:hypothetical protein